jgi:hypothetical protein
MAAPQNIIAVIFDFDDTLTDDSTTRLLEGAGIDSKRFWEVEMKALTDAGWDTPLAYMKLLLDNVGEGKPLGMLRNADLRNFGESLSFYPGIPQLFPDLSEIVARHQVSRPAIEFYIISGGLEEIIRGSSIAGHFSGIWGCRFAEEAGRIRHITNSVSFTEKTKYLFAINKGVADIARSNQFAVNNRVEAEDRRIPFANMIYIGDGITDVPCFSLLEANRGRGFGVFNPQRKDSPKKAWELLVAPRRVSTMNSPRYGKEDDLGALLGAFVESICLQLDTKTRSAAVR